MPRTKLTMRNTIPAYMEFVQRYGGRVWEGYVEEGQSAVFDPGNKMRPYWRVPRPVLRIETAGRGKHILTRYVVSEDRRSQSNTYPTLKAAKGAAVRYAARKFRVLPTAYDLWRDDI